MDVNTLLLIILTILALLRWYVFPPKPQIVEVEVERRVRVRQKPVDMVVFDDWLAAEIRKRGVITSNTTWLLTMFRPDELEVVEDNGYGEFKVQVREPVPQPYAPSVDTGFHPIGNYDELR